MATANKPSYPVKTRGSMKTIDVIFVSDNLVDSVILTRKDYERQQQRKLREEQREPSEDISTPEVKPKKRKANSENVPNKKLKIPDDVELTLAALENEEVEKETVKNPTTLFDDRGDVAAEKMCSFDVKKTYARSPISKKQTPLSNSTPKSKKPLERIEEETPASQTPYTLRKRVIKDIMKIKKILENSDEEDDFSASGSEYSGQDDPSESSSEENEEEEDKTDRRKGYFEMQSDKKLGSSNNTLKKLANPKLTREKVDEIFKQMKLAEAHKPQIKNLFRIQVASFEKWEYLLRHDYNILLYGVGSKKDIVEKFLLRFVNIAPVVTVNGFFPSISGRDILDKLSEILKLDSSSTDCLDNIEAKLRDFNLHIYIGVNNIDGIMLRSKKNQQIITRLARLPQIRLIATIDNINAPLLWDQCLLTDFNWAWFDSTSFLPYMEETVYEGNLLLHSSGHLTLASLRSVFGSLPKNSRAIFMILVRSQLAGDKTYTGLSFRELYKEGRRQLLVSADVGLRLQLKEFIDHAIVKQRRSPEGEEKFIISLDSSILKQFLEEQEAL